MALRTLYRRDHLDQVLATFGLILFFNELVRIGFGPAALFTSLPPSLSGSVALFGDAPYPVFRLAVIGVGLAAAALVWVLVSRTRFGAMVRAGSSNRAMAEAMGADISLLQRLVFAIAACLAGVAGMMLGPLTNVESGMGEPLLVLSLVVVIIGGIGSIHGAFVAALLVGLVDTTGRVLLPAALRAVMDQAAADGAGPALASMLVYIFMAVVLLIRPRGLFPPKG